MFVIVEEKEKVSPKLLDSIKAAVAWSCKFFKLDYKHDIELRIVLDKLEEGLQGYTLEHEPGWEYELVLNTGENEILKTIFHEMTHIKQHLHDGFAIFTKEAHFDGMVYTWDNWHEFESLYYRQSPWEVEAQKYENELLDKFIQEHPECL